jgi:hypothetical protein
LKIPTDGVRVLRRKVPPPSHCATAVLRRKFPLVELDDLPSSSRAMQEPPEASNEPQPNGEPSAYLIGTD